MADKKCRCNHTNIQHELVDDSWSKEGGTARGKCVVEGCECKHYNFNYGRWMYDRGYEDAIAGKEPSDS